MSKTQLKETTMSKMQLEDIKDAIALVKLLIDECESTSFDDWRPLRCEEITALEVLVAAASSVLHMAEVRRIDASTRSATNEDGELEL